MNSILATPSPPHHLQNPRLSPSRSSVCLHRQEPVLLLTRPAVSQIPASASSRKRKAEDDDPTDDQMATSSLSHARPLASYQRHSPKRSRTEPLGRPLSLPRLLETLDASSLRGVLQEVCTRHPTIAREIEATAPRPSVGSALSVLKTYEANLQAAFPYGGDQTSDYAYNRIRTQLMELLNALADFVPHFLPPHETQTSQSLSFLDGATDVIHRLPDWVTSQNNRHKQDAYEEISKAWVLALQEAGKRAGGLGLKYEGWESRLNKHNVASGGRLQQAVEELGRAVGWIGGSQMGETGRSDELNSVRQELLSGSYGTNVPVRVGPW